MKDLVLVTGINGFLGSAVGDALILEGWRVAGAVRHLDRLPNHRALSLDRVAAVGDMDGTTDWSRALTGVKSVIHTAAAASSSRFSPEALAAVNVGATVRLAKDAVKAGVERFIFVSSIKVHGESSGSAPFQETDVCEPSEPYAASKLEAEKALARIYAGTKMKVVVIRPVLIYGPGVRGSFYRLLQAIDKRIPLPFASLRNRRSMISVTNVASLLATCVSAEVNPFELFVVADPGPISTPDWIREISVAMGRKPMLVPVSPRLLSFTASGLGFSKAHKKLCGSLEVDASRVRTQLRWASPQSRTDALRDTAEWYLSNARRQPACAF